ncbi:hypothetical protein BC826DRAFT_45003 [Russula brevipes]|nr:hypothetical protein BC826DRAFT_45003 [Russula brevipes]
MNVGACTASSPNMTDFSKVESTLQVEHSQIDLFVVGLSLTLSPCGAQVRFRPLHTARTEAVQLLNISNRCPMRLGNRYRHPLEPFCLPSTIFAVISLPHENEGGTVSQYLEKGGIFGQKFSHPPLQSPKSSLELEPKGARTGRTEKRNPNSKCRVASGCLCKHERMCQCLAPGSVHTTTQSETSQPN